MNTLFHKILFFICKLYMDIIINAFNYYDKNSEYYRKFINSIKYYKVHQVFTDLERSSIFLYDEKENLLLESTYEILAQCLFIKDVKYWRWSWAYLYATQNSIQKTKQLINYGIEISWLHDPNERSNFDFQSKVYLKKNLVESSIKINNQEHQDLLLAISSYIIKMPLIIPINIENLFEKSNTLIRYDPDVDTPVYIILFDYKNLEI